MASVLMLRFPQRAAISAAACLSICVVDLGLHARAITRTIPLSQWRQQNPILDHVARDIGLHRLLAPQCLVSDREAWQRGIAKVQAYEPVTLARWGEFFAALYPADDPAKMLTGFQPAKLSNYHQPLVNLLGVKYAAVVGHKEDPPVGWKLVKRDLIQLEATLRGVKPRGLKYSLFENLSPIPRAFVSSRVNTVTSVRAAWDALRHFNPRETVIVGSSFPKLPSGQEPELTPVDITSYKTTRIVLQTTLTRPGALCLTDFYFPGWCATDNGIACPIFTGNFAFRAIPLDAGQHKVTLEFSPPGMRLGGIISLVASAIWTISVLRTWKSRPSARVEGETP